jgi:hypothetical protein
MGREQYNELNVQADGLIAHGFDCPASDDCKCSRPRPPVVYARARHLIREGLRNAGLVADLEAIQMGSERKAAFRQQSAGHGVLPYGSSHFLRPPFTNLVGQLVACR